MPEKKGKRKFLVMITEKNGAFRNSLFENVTEDIQDGLISKHLPSMRDRLEFNARVLYFVISSLLKMLILLTITMIMIQMKMTKINLFANAVKYWILRELWWYFVRSLSHYLCSKEKKKKSLNGKLTQL